MGWRYSRGRRSGLLAEEEVLLVRSAQRGEPEAFDRLVDWYAPGIYNFALRMLQSAEEAEDAAQEAFVRAYTSLRQFRGRSSFATWLHRVAMNVCLDQIKRRRRQPFSLAREDPPTEPRLPASEGDPASAAERRERQAIIRSAIDSLPEAQRAIVVLYDLEGLSYQECAQALNTSVGTVKSRLNRARLALKTKLAPQLELLRSG